MPLSLAALTAETAHATLDLGDGDTLELDWYPKRFSSEMMRRIEAAEQVKDMSTADALATLDAAADILCTLVARWDLVEYIADDGTPGPTLALTPERLRACSLELVWLILMKLLAETRMGEAKGTPRKRR